MKRTIILLTFLVSFPFVVCSCSSEPEVYLHGLDQYHPANSSMSISKYLLPSEDFLKKYDYINGDYYYIDTGLFSKHSQESELLYVSYEDAVYEEAKQFSLKNYSFSLIHQYNYNGYAFYETLLLPKLYDNLNAEGENESFPYHFNFFSYNDDKKIMVFIGFYLYKGDSNEIDKELLTFSDMGAFLKEYFSFYDFDA